MTGYGRAQGNRDQWQCVMEVRSVNHRFLDVMLRLQSGYQFLEGSLRQTVKNQCGRGKVEVICQLFPVQQQQAPLALNIPRATNLIQILKQFEAVTSRPVAINLGDLLKINNLIETQELETDEELLQELAVETLEMALSQLLEMRSREGAALIEDIRERLGTLEVHLRTISQAAEGVVEHQYKRLMENLGTLEGKLTLDDQRIQTEIALFADRCDISEEVTRFQTHLEAMRSLITEEEIGRKADFLLQELNREANTMASKSSRVAINQTVVEVKSQLEKIREQIQNIE